MDGKKIRVSFTYLEFFIQREVDIDEDTRMSC